jgi:hypothetical protein
VRLSAAALIGWYLMVPPIVPLPFGKDTVGMIAHDDAPFSQWTLLRSYDTATSCMAERDARAEAAKHEVTTAPSNDSDLRGQLLSATENRSVQCIATDDPRLKGN